MPLLGHGDHHPSPSLYFLTTMRGVSSLCHAHHYDVSSLHSQKQQSEPAMGRDLGISELKSVFLPLCCSPQTSCHSNRKSTLAILGWRLYLLRNSWWKIPVMVDWESLKHTATAPPPPRLPPSSPSSPPLPPPHRISVSSN